MRHTFKTTSLLVAAGFIFASSVPALADTTVYFTRHAEKQTVMAEVDGQDGVFQEVCGESKCSEELNAEGELRAELLAEWFAAEGITANVTHVFSSHKTRTRQTVEQIAADAGLTNDADLIADGVQQIPSANTNDLDDGNGSEGTKSTVAPTVAALQALESGSVAVVAGHSGTIYPMIEALGVDISSEADFPKDTREGKEGKVPTFGDIWKLTLLDDGSVQFDSRVNLQPGALVVQ